MSVGSLDIITDGLVFCFDPANNKSFISGSTSSVDMKNNTTLTFKNKIYNGGTGDIVTSITPTYNSNNGGSIYFNGVGSLSGDGLYLPTSDTTTNLTSQVTLSVWFKKMAYPTWVESPAAKGYNTPGSQPFIIYLLSGSIHTRVTTNTSGGYTDISTPYNTNVWNNIVLTYDGSNMNLYLNGELKATSPKTGPIMNATTSPFNIGCQNNGGYYPSSSTCKTDSFFKGYISNVSLYNRGLTSQEILHNYNKLKWRFL